MNCPCCGQPYFVETGKLSFVDNYRLVSDGVQEVRLTPTEYKILTAVRRRSLSMDELVEAVYADRPDGGPVTAKNSLSVLMVKLNRALKPLGIRVGAERKGAWAPPYKIEHVAR